VINAETPNDIRIEFRPEAYPSEPEAYSMPFIVIVSNETQLNTIYRSNIVAAKNKIQVKNNVQVGK